LSPLFRPRAAPGPAGYAVLLAAEAASNAGASILLADSRAGASDLDLFFSTDGRELTTTLGLN